MANFKQQVMVYAVAMLLLLPIRAFSGEVPEPDLMELLEQAPNQQQDISLSDLFRLVRDEQIPGTKARKRLIELLAAAREKYYQSGGTDALRADWYFPVSGYDIKAITGGRKHGYIARGYDFYAGNRHGGHPSLDIFIHDRNRDRRDDRSGEQVKIISVTSGVVVSAEDHWEEGSGLRGGKYLWVYDPGNDLLVYYAHNEKLLLKVGDMVRPGDALAIMGRSGLNAAKKRSPTHLHLTVIKVNGGRMKPLDFYQSLKSAKLFTAG